MIDIVFERINEDAVLPRYASEGAAGMDVVSPGRYIIAPGGRDMIHTGLKVRVPEGYEMQCRSRSGLAMKHGVMVLNSPGTIDSDYRGELVVILINHGDEFFHINPGDRVAQLVVAEAPLVNLFEGSVDNDTIRGEGGFGSTGR